MDRYPDMDLLDNPLDVICKKAPPRPELFRVGKSEGNFAIGIRSRQVMGCG